MKVTAFWDMTPYSLGDMYQCQPATFIFMNVAGSSKMLAPHQKSNWGHLPEDGNLLVALDISLITGLILDTNARYCILISSLVRYFEVVKYLYK